MRVLQTRLRRATLIASAGATAAVLTVASPSPAQASSLGFPLWPKIAISTASAASDIDVRDVISSEASRDQARQSQAAATAAADGARVAAEQAAAAEAARVVVEQAEAARQQAIVSSAEQASGGWYRWGGTTPSGFDCSGYTQYVYAQHGLSLPRTSAAQRAATEKVSQGELRPGDLVFQARGGRVHHVSIFAGDGMVYEALQSGTRVGLKAMRVKSGTSFGRLG